MNIYSNQNKILEKFNEIKLNMNVIKDSNIENLSKQSVVFSDIFEKNIKKINSNIINSENLSKEFLLGKSNVGINEVMIEMQKSAISLNFGIQVNNKIVGAYQEIMNMSI
ncbi:fliE [Wigglesworthia glossinidia endosymbiont of Glossina brevipalpis]|uniref:Flagellar hook-basal body complex protein FliE n=1 Tax=Wigglesworthia glossinidia brevipalpis TaxID=36870 RepID=Q8D3E0_WIGBR|nr:fliE [Wigglesworthia glossinidia endosymbiont of Glossina brevipalpis]